MIVNADYIFNRIDEIVERSYLDFTFDIIGDDFFTENQKRQVEALGLLVGTKPLIELVYTLVRQRSTPGYRQDRTVNELLDEIARSGVLPVINDTHQYSIDHAKGQINQAIEDTKTLIKKKVKEEILKVNNEYKNEIAAERIVAVPNLAEKREEKTALLLAGIAGVALAAQSDFVRAFTTSLTDTANNAAVDEATSQIAMRNISPKDTLVYKQVINDGSLCKWCDSFYTDADGKPKIYRLEELQTNGSNYGLPKSAWKPTIGSTHPRCRCQLQYVNKNQVDDLN